MEYDGRDPSRRKCRHEQVMRQHSDPQNYCVAIRPKRLKRLKRPEVVNAFSSFLDSHFVCHYPSETSETSETSGRPKTPFLLLDSHFVHPLNGKFT